MAVNRFYQYFKADAGRVIALLTEGITPMIMSRSITVLLPLFVRQNAGADNSTLASRFVQALFSYNNVRLFEAVVALIEAVPVLSEELLNPDRPQSGIGTAQPLAAPVQAIPLPPEIIRPDIQQLLLSVTRDDEIHRIPPHLYAHLMKDREGIPVLEPEGLYEPKLGDICSHNPHEDDHPISSTEEVRFNLFPEANTLAAGAFFVTRSGAQLHAHTFSGANLAYAQSKCKEASASVGRVCFVVDRIFKASDYQTCVGGRAVAGNIPMAVYRGKLDPEDIWQTSPQDLRASGFDLPVYIDGFRTSDAETASPVTNTGSNVSERLGDSPFGADSVLPGSAMRPTGSNNVAGDGSCGPPPNGASPFTRSRASPSFEFDPIGPLERLIFENTPGVKRSVLRLSDAARFEALCAPPTTCCSAQQSGSAALEVLRGLTFFVDEQYTATFDWTFLDGHRPSDEHELPAVANPSKSGDAHDPEQLASDSTEPMPLGSEFKDAQPTSINDRSSAASLTPPVSASARSLNATLGGREGLSSKNGEATKHDTPAHSGEKQTSLAFQLPGPGPGFPLHSTASAVTARQHSESSTVWFTDYESLVTALSHHMTSFVLSRRAHELLSAAEVQGLADDTVAAAKALMRIIILERRHTLQLALMDLMRQNHLAHFLQGELTCPPVYPHFTTDGCSAELAPRGPSPAPLLPRRPLLPPSPECLGRTAERQMIIDAISSDRPGLTPVVVLGGSGIGKTTLALNALLSAEAQKSFGDQRYFVRCEEGVATHRGFVTAIVRSLGLDLVGQTDPLTEVVQFLLPRPSLVVVDNVGTVWDGPHRAEVESILQHLCTATHLIVTVSGNLGPRLLGQHICRVFVGRFDKATAREVFLHHAPSSQNDPHLDALIEELDRYPLALVLVAQQVVPGASLEYLLKERWQRKRLLAGNGQSRLASVEASVRLSLETTPIQANPASVQLLALICSVPDGLSETTTIQALLGRLGFPAINTLVQVGLAFRSSSERVRVLRPIREMIVHRVRLRLEDGYLDQLDSHFLACASSGSQIGTPDGRSVIDGIRTEFLNVEHVLLRRIHHARFGPELFEAIRGVAHFQRCTGLGGLNMLERAEQKLGELGMTPSAAAIRLERAIILANRTSFGAAEELASQSLRELRAVADERGQASSLAALAQIAIEQKNLSKAESYAKTALGLYRRQRPVDQKGSASAQRQLGMICNLRGEYDAAFDWFTGALAIWNRTSSLLNQGGCHHGIGYALWKKRQYTLAVARFEDAIECFDQAGEVLSKVFARRDVGSVKLAQGRVADGEEHLRAALAEFTEIGLSSGMATCRRELGRSARKTRRFMIAVQHLYAASDLFRASGDGDAADEMWNEAEECSIVTELLLKTSGENPPAYEEGEGGQASLDKDLPDEPSRLSHEELNASIAGTNNFDRLVSMKARWDQEQDIAF